jgi:hypothetical protein
VVSESSSDELPPAGKVEVEGVPALGG